VVDVPDTAWADYDSTNALTNPVTATHPTGTLVQYGFSPTTYYIEDGKKRIFPDLASFRAFRFRPEFVMTLPQTVSYPDGEEMPRREI
jgi:hypothetical protein